ncbi:MAG: eCIS core domain-containing protein, partial [Flavisolibacter sp.]
HGKDIYFNRDKYNPGSKDGQHLLAHELTHTIQQGASAQRKMVQRNGNTNTNKPAKKEFPKLDIPAKSLEIEEINLPDFKARNKQKFKEPLLSLQPRPANLDQANVWKFGADGKAGVKPDVDKFVETWLTGKMDKTQQGVYFLISNSSQFRLFGTLAEIQKECYIPKWDKAGQPCIHQVDHIVEMQLGGSNDPSNFELSEATANMSSGNSIKLERERRMNAALDKLYTDPSVPKPMPPRSHFNTEYITSYEKIVRWNLPYKGKGGIFWTYDEIKKGDHMSRLRQMTPTEKEKSEGSKDDFVLYIRKGSGSPMRIKMNSINPDKEWIKGIQLTEFKIDKDTAANDEDYGYIKVKLSKRFKDLKADSDFTFRFKKMPYFFNTGYLVFDPKTDQKFVNMLQFMGLSPIEIHEFRLDEINGLVMNGNIITNIPIIDKTPIAISMIGDDFTVSKTFQLGDVKDKFPKPFKVNDVSLSIFASMKNGLGVEGTLDFEVDKIGKGQLKGMGSTFNGFGIEGSFEFDPELFKSKIKASYKDKKFAFDGSVTMEKEKIPGVQSLTITVKYENEKLGGTGKAKLNIPGVKEIGIEVEQLETGGLKIAGDIEFGSKLKSDAKVQAVFEKGEAGWDVSIKGTLNPNVDIAGLKITKVEASFAKGIFDVSAKVQFEKGKIKGDFDLGVTNSNIDADGKKLEGLGKELAFYASGEVTLDIVKGVDGKLLVKITKDGDIIIGGKVEVKEDKSIVDGKSGNMKTDKSLKIFEFGQKIPIASCGVASVVLELKAGVGLFYDFKGLTLDKGTNVTLEPVSLNELSKAKITSDISLSTGVKAGVDAFIEASAGLEVLIAGIKGKGRVNLKLTAFDANAKATVGAGFSAEKGLEFKTAEMEFDVKSKIGFDVDIGVEVYLNLLVTDVTLWEHSWKPESLKGEYEFSWFDGKLKVPLKFGENNSLKPEDVGSGLKGQMDEHAKDEESYKSGAESGINEKGPDPKAENAKTEKRIKDGVAIAYRGAHSKEVFAFNSTMSAEYFSKRVQSWKIVNEHKTLKSEIKELLKKEIIQYEREEFDAFKKWLQDDTTFDADSKNLIINDFMAYRPTLKAEDKSELVGAANSSAMPDNSTSNSSSSGTTSSNTSPGPPSNNPLVLKKALPGEHGYAVPDDFADRMQDAKANGLPLPLDVRAEMGKEFGADFSQVRVHYDDESFALTSAVNAQAFTHENHIFFNNGKYEPGSSDGKKLLAHELTHVLQQGHGEPVKRIAEKDATGTRFTGNYIFNPGHDGLNSSFFSKVKGFVGDGNLSDPEIRTLRKDAIDRNGSVLHAELLLMAAMRNPVNVTLMQAHRGGSLILAMSNILQADKDYVINFDRGTVPPDLAHPYLRLLVAALGLSGETVIDALAAMDRAAEQYILKVAGRQFFDHANKLIVSAGFTNPVVPLFEIVEAMVNGSADSTPGDQIMAGSAYLIAEDLVIQPLRRS